MTNTSFSSREWLTKDETATQEQLTKKEQLKQACWNGLIPELLPECFENPLDRSLILWEINEANAFIDLEYGDFVKNQEKNCSINPYIFIEVQDYN